MGGALRQPAYPAQVSEWFEEFRLYHRKDGKVVKLNDDLLSATRYAVMMLRHINEDAHADRIQNALEAVLADGKTVTADLGGSASTTEFTDAVIAKVQTKMEVWSSLGSSV